MRYEDKITPSFSKNRVRLQLEGFMHTAPLWTANAFNLPQLKVPNLESVIDPLESISDKLYLGKRVEYFLEAILTHSQRFKVLEKNIQIIHGKRTIGELDFIVQDNKENAYIHLEQIYKFYVYDPSITKPLERFIGPNRKDRLVDKISKLKTQQLPLLYHSQTKHVISTILNSKHNVQQRVCFKAHCFVPHNLKGKSYELQHINPNSVSGYYLKGNEFAEFEDYNYKFAFPTKIDWPILPQHNRDWLTYTEAKRQLQLHMIEKRAPLVWIKKPDGYERIFIVWW